MSTGIENPTPDDAPEGEYIAVFIPIRFPELSRSGPPLFPGFIAASVWITSCIGRPVAAELISLLSPLHWLKWIAISDIRVRNDKIISGTNYKFLIYLMTPVVSV